MHWSPNVLVGASDASHDIAHSNSAYVFLMANAAISWAVKKQHSIALTPYHAEVMAGSLAAWCEAVFLRGLLTEMDVLQLSQPSSRWSAARRSTLLTTLFFTQHPNIHNVAISSYANKSNVMS